jgi:hypothetical protein
LRKEKNAAGEGLDGVEDNPKYKIKNGAYS